MPGDSISPEQVEERSPVEAPPGRPVAETGDRACVSQAHLCCKCTHAFL